MLTYQKETKKMVCVCIKFISHIRGINQTNENNALKCLVLVFEQVYFDRVMFIRGILCTQNNGVGEIHNVFSLTNQQ